MTSKLPVQKAPEESMQHSKTQNLFPFFYFKVIFALLNPNLDPANHKQCGMFLRPISKIKK